MMTTREAQRLDRVVACRAAAHEYMRAADVARARGEFDLALVELEKAERLLDEASGLIEEG